MSLRFYRNGGAFAHFQHHRAKIGVGADGAEVYAQALDDGAALIRRFRLSAHPAVSEDVVGKQHPARGEQALQIGQIMDVLRLGPV